MVIKDSPTEKDEFFIVSKILNGIDEFNQLLDKNSQQVD